jgi:hypothetical protein
MEERFLHYADRRVRRKRTRKKKSVCSGRNDGVGSVGVVGCGLLRSG